MAHLWRRLLAVLAAGCALSLGVGVAQGNADSSTSDRQLLTAAGYSQLLDGEATKHRGGGAAQEGRGLQPLSAEEREHLVELLMAATVRVSATGCGHKVTGSGFVVDEMVVSNNHVVGDAYEFTIDRPLTSAWGPATVPVSASYPTIDLAIGPVSGIEPGGSAVGVARAALTFSSNSPIAGEPVLVAGYGGGRDLSVVHAQVQGVVDGTAYGNEGSVLLLDGSTVAGFSGGPVIDRSGGVIGVLRAYDSLTGLAIATPATMVLDAVRSNSMQYQGNTCN